LGFEHTLFCAIQPAERDAYVSAVLRWLKPMVITGRELYDPDKDGPPFGTTRRNWGTGSLHSSICGKNGCRALTKPDGTGIDALVEEERGEQKP